jgi:hypothetical protein
LGAFVVPKFSPATRVPALSVFSEGLHFYQRRITMALEDAVDSVASDDNFRLAFVPEGSNAKSAAILNAAEEITYAFTPAGFNRTTTQETIQDPRLTKLQNLTRPGKVSEGVEVQFVFGGEGDVLTVLLAKDVKGTVVARYAVPNETPWTAAQVADIIPVQAGVQRKDAPTENGVWTKSQTLFVTGTVETDAILAV